ncbi:dihydrolipoamide dehydrogenase [Dyadobacter jejuensis]|uniref:Dihydrolipoyl dehydrogenase n=1 Tax=Dyadobacter jejuensis TaxID=1082580 RepID=A0A316AH01_9BACT|nr:dihydrolipoyl dehydrogenase [Dyadobacter jejuensis]PWJ56538.1 dihydrolipoamide dehydrogenase [Dyadobacter jejuensis]
MAQTYDVIVIGSGPGGYPAAIRASQLGLKVAIVEKESLGGICLNWGCIPTKALLKSAQVFEYIKHAKDYGINVSESSADFGAVIKRSRGVAEGMSKGVAFLMKKNKIDVIMGAGKAKGVKTVEVTDKDGKKVDYTANKGVIIATGARARELPNIKIDGQKVIEYRKAMSLEKQPKSLLVVGSGAIGMEFAYVYAAMGTKVTVVEFMPNLVPVEDEDISKEIAKQYKKLGVDTYVNSSVEKVDTSGEGCKVLVKTPSGEKTFEVDVVLSAAGIVSNIENIGLEETGIKTDKGKIAVNEWYETSVPGFYAIGDCTPGPALAHVATAEGIICAEKLAGHKTEALDYGNIPGCTYCQPEIASVGFTEKKAREAGYDIKVGKFPFMASGKASAAGAKEGFVKVIFDAKYGEFLGAHMIGMNVTEMIAEVVVARKLETTSHEILRSVHPHPTMSEAVKGATEAAYGEAIDL